MTRKRDDRLEAVFANPELRWRFCLSASALRRATARGDEAAADEARAAIAEILGKGRAAPSRRGIVSRKGERVRRIRYGPNEVEDGGVLRRQRPTWGRF